MHQQICILTVIQIYHFLKLTGYSLRNSSLYRGSIKNWMMKLFYLSCIAKWMDFSRIKTTHSVVSNGSEPTFINKKQALIPSAVSMYVHIQLYCTIKFTKIWLTKTLMVKNLFWLWCQHVKCSRLYTADLLTGTINISEPNAWHQHLYPGIEDIGFNCLQPEYESSLHISTCCSLFQPGAS